MTHLVRAFTTPALRLNMPRMAVMINFFILPMYKEKLLLHVSLLSLQHYNYQCCKRGDGS